MPPEIAPSMPTGGGSPATQTAPTGAGTGAVHFPVGGETHTSPSSSAKPGKSGSQPLSQPGLKSATKPATSPAAQTTPSHDPNQTYEVTINNKKVSMTLQEMMDKASMSHAATERFQKASEYEKKWERLKGGLTTDPFQTLLDPELGLSKEQIREKLEDYYHREFIEAEKLSPAERDLKAAQQRLKEYEEKETKANQLREQEEEQRNVAQASERIQQQIIEALEGNELLPKDDPFIVGRLAFYMRQNNLQGWNAPMDMIVRQVHNDTKSLVGSVTSKMSGEQLVKTLGDQVVQTLLKHHLEKIRSNRNSLQSTETGQNRTQNEIPKRVSMSDVDQNLKKMRMGQINY